MDTQVQNSRDFVDNFVPNFFRDFARLGVQAGAAASGGSTSNEPRGPIVVQLQLNKRTIEEITIEMDDLESQGRISRTRQRKSLIGKEDPNRR